MGFLMKRDEGYYFKDSSFVSDVSKETPRPDCGVIWVSDKV
jgi:hypothetical protein